jgi:MICOS complex subunit MIC26
VAGNIAEPPQRKVRPAPTTCTTLRADGVRQLSIYPEPEREIVVLDSPSVLETQIGVARRAVTGVAYDVHAQVHGVVSKWIDIEHAVERASCPLSLIPKISNTH